MARTLLTLIVVGLLPTLLPAAKKQERKPHPLAPSLPQLTDEEEEQIGRIIDRFILADTGRLRGAEAKKASSDFDDLGPEAIFCLIRGLNKAAKIDASCPALKIGRKVGRILRASSDVELLEFARENIGAGVTRTRHGSILNELRVVCMVRKRVVAVNNPNGRGKKVIKPVRKMSVVELSAAMAGERRVPRLKLLMAELASRGGEEVINALGSAAAKEGQTGVLGRTFLVSHLRRLESKVIAKKLKDERASVRAAAVQAAGSKDQRLGSEVIALLTDSSPEVRQAAHQALVKLSRGADYGPGRDASSSERAEAVKRWRDWWDRENRR
jgi:hypothetical protein